MMTIESERGMPEGAKALAERTLYIATMSSAVPKWTIYSASSFLGSYYQNLPGVTSADLKKAEIAFRIALKLTEAGQIIFGVGTDARQLYSKLRQVRQKKLTLDKAPAV